MDSRDIDDRKVDIEIPSLWLTAVTKEMERVFNINGTKVRHYLAKYLQEQYDAREDKTGSIKLDMPTVKEFKEYILQGVSK